MRIALLILLTVTLARAAEVKFEEDVAPVLRAYCVGCHNAESPENGLSVETFAALKKGGDDRANPLEGGANSFFLKSVEKRARPHMPPKDEPQPTASELEALRAWMAAGAPGPREDVSILEKLVVPKIESAVKALPVTAASWSPDGKLMAVASGGKIELKSGLKAKARVVIDFGSKVNAVVFSRDGKLLIVAGGVTGLRGAAKVFDTKSGAFVREFPGHKDALFDAELSPDGKILATAGYDRVIRLWEAANGKLLRSISVHNGAVFDLAFDPSGKVLASASADQTVKLWRVSDGVRLDTLNQPQGELNAVAFTPDGKHILAAGNDKRIHMWKFVSSESPELNPVEISRFAHEAPITAMALSPDGARLVTAAADQTLKIWSVPELTEIHAYEKQPDQAHALAFRPNGKDFLVARMNGSLQALEPYRMRSAEDATKRRTASSRRTAAPGKGLTLPAEIKGTISEAGEADEFRFYAEAGDNITFEVNAARSGSKLDSRLQILDAKGDPVEQVVLQGTRDSWFTFRGKDSDTSGDFRLHNWAEMELNELLYANGEVVKLWLYPRGPDSGFIVYPGEGKRQTLFNTTALTHALNEPSYIVTAHPPRTKPAPNGLPVFRLNWENDDDPYRRNGADSLLLFKAPATSEYVLKLTDTRGFGGTNYTYTLSARETKPDFSVAVEGANPSVSPGSGRELRFVATRREGFEGPIDISLSNLPDGFSASGPLQIEAGQISALAVIYAKADAKAPATNHVCRIFASAQIDGKEARHEVANLGQIKLAAKPKLTVEILAGPNTPQASGSSPGALHFTIRQGQTISARVRATRHDFKDRIELGIEDSGRNLPHGVYVDNIGLNGLLIVEGQSERDFFITASKIAALGTRPFHLRAKGDGGQASQTVMLTVLPREGGKVASR